MEKQAVMELFYSNVKDKYPSSMPLLEEVVAENNGKISVVQLANHLGLTGCLQDIDHKEVYDSGNGVSSRKIHFARY